MSDLKQRKLRITIDTKCGILRIHRTVLKALGDPQYVRLLIDREAHEAAVQQANFTDRDRIEAPDYAKPYRFQINSKALTESLAHMMGWRQGAAYQVEGILGEGLALFDLKRAVEKKKAIPAKGPLEEK